MRLGAHGLDGAALRQLAFAYLGSVPAGLEDKDTPRAAAETTPVQDLLAAFATARAEIAFDDEVKLANTPRIQSLHVTLTAGGR
jgi:hypothetical protein